MGFKVGFAEIVITPEIGLPMGGYGARIGNSTGIHDNLFARAVYMNFNTQESLLISMDVLSLPLVVIKYYRQLIHHATGIDKQRICICALHNHSGPDTIGITHPLRGLFRLRLQEELFIKIGKKMIELCLKAKHTCQDALFATGKNLMEQRLIINRREPLKDSKYEVKIIQFSTLIGELIGLIINYACHGTVLPSDNTLYTAEYPGYLAKRIKDRLGQKVSVVYLNGPCGDLNPNLFNFNVDLAELEAKKDLLYDGPGHVKGTFKRAREIGYAIADHAINLTKQLTPKPIHHFNYLSKSYLLTMDDLFYEKSMKMYYLHFRYKLKLNLFKTLWKLARIKGNTIPFPLDHVKRGGKYYQEAEIHCLQLNNTAIVGLPGELFSELGMRITKNSPFQNTFVVELANGYLGYLYPLKDYKKGGYELFLSLNPTAGTYLTNKSLVLLEALKK
ncbi:MAG: hypothetical protein ACTSRC_10660 [Candidatus Helarchaeota archaeon]